MDREAGPVTNPWTAELGEFLGAVAIVGGFYLAYHVVRALAYAVGVYAWARKRFDEEDQK